MASSGLRDGIIRTYDLFTAYSPGYFQLEILACDLAGHSTTTNVNIYILRDDQRVKIVFNEIPDLVRENQEEFISLLSNITGAIVNMDDIQVSPRPPRRHGPVASSVARLRLAAVPRGQEGQGELRPDGHAHARRQQSHQHHLGRGKVAIVFS